MTHPEVERMRDRYLELLKSSLLGRTHFDNELRQAMFEEPVRFFLDTASPAEIEKWDEFGVVQGVTTNPFLLSQEKADAHAQIKQIV